MKTNWNHSGRRHFLLPRQSGSVLLQSFILFSLLLTVSPACLITSCREKDDESIQDVSVQVDSSWFKLSMDVFCEAFDSLPRVRCTDVLVYDADDIGSLESWKRYDYLPDSLVIRGAKKAKRAVVIVNSPRTFNRIAIDRYDSMELLCCEFDEDSPEAPLMSGTCQLLPEASGHISLTPLMSRVQLCEISNTMKGYARLEDPRIYLENMNSAAEVMRGSGFRPSELLDDTRKKPLPFDIGIFSQKPMTELFCYPNESPEATVGSPQTILVLECEIYGNTCRFPVTLGEIGRNKTLHVNITVGGPELYESKVY